MNIIKALFVISYISQIAYLVINFSLYYSFELYWFFWFIVNLRYEKQCLYPSRIASEAVFIIMICMGVQEISVGGVWICGITNEMKHFFFLNL